MNALTAGALITQALVTLVGGGYALFKYAAARGANQEKLDRIIKQVEPNKGTSLRDDVTSLRDELRRYAASTDARLQRLEKTA